MAATRNAGDASKRLSVWFVGKAFIGTKQKMILDTCTVGEEGLLCALGKEWVDSLQT